MCGLLDHVTGARLSWTNRLTNDDDDDDDDFISFIKFCHFTINLHLIIKVKIINMARKPKRNQEAYTRLGFLPKQTKIEYHQYRARCTVRCDTRFR